jgi:hypothetical protein
LFASHASALADAGKALYAHFGGDPNSATHEDIATFHNELLGAAKGGPPVKMRSGGVVPGSGNRDSVPALLTPGEYVMNKDAVSNIGVGTLQQMNNPRRFAGGGYVDDDDDQQQRQPRETKHRRVTVPSPSSSAPPPAPSQSSSPASSYTSPTPNTPARSVFDNLTSSGPISIAGTPAAGGGYQEPYGYVGGSPGAGQSGYIYPSQSAATAAGDVGPGPGGSNVGPGAAGAASGIGSLASGLAEAAKKYADSIKPWQMQKSAIPNPDDFRRQQQPITFSQMET